jgi:hypothetical protein
LPGTQIIETLEVTAADAEFISFETSYRLPDTTLVTNSRLRFPSHHHVEDLIHRSELVVQQVFGDWNSAPFESACSPEMIFVAGTTQRPFSSVL